MGRIGGRLDIMILDDPALVILRQVQDTLPLFVYSKCQIYLGDGGWRILLGTGRSSNVRKATSLGSGCTSPFPTSSPVISLLAEWI